MFRWFHEFRAKRAARAKTEALLKRDGFITYCKGCQAELNDVDSEWLDDDRHEFRCPCGVSNTFLFGPPVPIFLSMTQRESPTQKYLGTGP